MVVTFVKQLSNSCLPLAKYSIYRSESDRLDRVIVVGPHNDCGWIPQDLLIESLCRLPCVNS